MHRARLVSRRGALGYTIGCTALLIGSEMGWNVALNVGSCEAWVQLCLVVGLGEASLRCESGGKTGRTPY